MKAYVITTGVVFGLITAAHVLRAVVEGPHLATEPSFVFTSIISVALSVWAFRIFRAQP